MKERIKSAVLLLLVLCSLFLTHRLWFGRQPAEATEDNGYEPVYFEETRPLSQMISPKQIHVCRDGQHYRIRPGDSGFNLFWEELSGMLQEIAEPEYYYYEEGLPREAGLCLAVQFEPFLPLGPESIWLRNGPRRELAEMQIWRSDERCWAILQENDETSFSLLLPPGWGTRLAGLHDRFIPGAEQLCDRLPAGELRLSRKDTVKLAAPLYVPVGILTMDRLRLKPEQLDRELLLKTFFIKRHLVREIKEKDGGLVYTDGEQGLRLGNGLDYLYPRPEQSTAGLSYTAALLTAGKLIGYHGGWPGDLRLTVLSRGGQGKDYSRGPCRAEWRTYLYGHPLLGDSGVRMIYHHGGLQNYRRNLYEPVERPGTGTEVTAFREALQAGVLMLQTEEAGQFTLEEMELAYYPIGAEAVPVWLIRLSGREIILKTDELTPPEGWEP